MPKPSSTAASLEADSARFLRDVDRTLLRRNLTLSHEQRLLQLQELSRFADELRHAGGTSGRTPGK